MDDVQGEAIKHIAASALGSGTAHMEEASHHAVRTLSSPVDRLTWIETGFLPTVSTNFLVIYERTTLKVDHLTPVNSLDDFI